MSSIAEVINTSRPALAIYQTTTRRLSQYFSIVCYLPIKVSYGVTFLLDLGNVRATLFVCYLNFSLTY